MFRLIPVLATIRTQRIIALTMTILSRNPRSSANTMSPFGMEELIYAIRMTLLSTKGSERKFRTGKVLQGCEAERKEIWKIWSYKLKNSKPRIMTSF